MYASIFCTKKILIQMGIDMDKDELDVILADHVKWLRGEGGGRANLADANLADANLAGANLADANLAQNRYLIGCTLTNFPIVAFMHRNELRITCGCRRGLTIEQARAHWSPDNESEWTEKKAGWGEQRLRMIDFLEAEAKHLGWIK